MEPLPNHARDENAFLARLRERAGNSGAVTFAEFMRTALYDPKLGYYSADRDRVGLSGKTDFYTSSSMHAVFGRLVAAAAARLLGESAEKHTFVEIGAEPGKSVLEGVPHPFAQVKTLRLGEKLEIPGRAVVFSNELFDAQPFHRVKWRDGAWCEIGVKTDGYTLSHVQMPLLSEPVRCIAHRLPEGAVEGYTLDLPTAAESLTTSIGAGRWSGVFIAFDYGRTWDYLCHAAPEGTARAYRRHKQSNDLLAQPGRQDLTCHVCWDWMEEALKRNGFLNVQRQSQEAFLIHHAGPTMEQIMREDPDPLSLARAQMKELLHPGLLGQKLEVLFGVREIEG